MVLSFILLIFTVTKTNKMTATTIIIVIIAFTFIYDAATALNENPSRDIQWKLEIVFFVFLKNLIRYIIIALLILGMSWLISYAN